MEVLWSHKRTRNGFHTLKLISGSIGRIPNHLIDNKMLHRVTNTRCLQNYNIQNLTSSHSNLLMCHVTLALVLKSEYHDLALMILQMFLIGFRFGLFQGNSSYLKCKTKRKTIMHIKRLLWDDVINDFCKIWPNSCQQRIWESWREVKFWMLKFCKDHVFVTLWSILLSIKWLGILPMDPLISFNVLKPFLVLLCDHNTSVSFDAF